MRDLTALWRQDSQMPMSTPSKATWICKASRDKPNSIAVPYRNLVQNKVAGFSLVNVDPARFKGPKEINASIRLKNPVKGHITGRTFGPQAWAIYHEAKPGDRIFLECADAANKPKGGHSTFIVAAGTITGPFKYSPNDKGDLGLLSIGVDWQWEGKRLIKYGHYMYCFTEIAPKASNARLLADLDAIWEGESGADNQLVDGEITTGDATRSIKFDPEWKEGDAKMRHHLTIERCSKAAKAAKNVARATNGVLLCKACGKDTVKIYGHELIDAHHIIPLADTKGMSRVPKVEDFAMLCPTCHRAVHKELKAGAVGPQAIDIVRRRAR